MPKAKHLLLAALAVLAFFLAAFDLWTGAAVVPWDAHDFFTPTFVTLADFTRAGHLLLWNPWMAGGIPDHIEPQLGAFSPLMLIVGLLCGGTLVGFRVYFLTIWGLSGIGVFLLGRRLNASVWGSALIAFNWLFSGFLLGHAQHVSWIYSMGWLPIIVLVLDQALERGSWKRFAAAGALWGLSLLGGYPGIVFNDTLLVVGWAIGRTLFPARDAAWSGRPLPRRAAFACAGLAIFAVVGCFIMTPNMAGMLIEGVGVTSRSGAIARESAVGNNPLGWWCLGSFASPFLASLPPARLWPRTDLSMANVYVGALTLVLAMTALITRRLARFCLLAGAVFLFLVALGPETPLRGWLYDFVPFTRFFQHPSMYSGPAMFLLVVLALLGIRDLDQRRVHRLLPLLVAALLSVGAWMTLGLVAGRAKVVPTSQAWTHFGLAWLGTTLGLAIYAVIGRRKGRWQLLFAVPMALAAFFDAYLCDKMLVTHADRRPGVAASERSILRSHRTGLDLGSMSGLERAERIQPGLGVPGFSAWALVRKTPVLSGYTALRNSFFEAIAQTPQTRQLAVGNVKTWFSATAVEAPPTPELFNAFLTRSAVVGTPALAIHQPDDFRHPRLVRTDQVLAMQAAPPVVALNARLIQYLPTVLEMQVEAPTDGWLLVTDRWAPGWRAEINGQASALYPADFVFRTVHVKAGANKVRFRYQPPYVIPTLLLCWGTLLLVAFLQFDRGWLLRTARRILGAARGQEAR